MNKNIFFKSLFAVMMVHTMQTASAAGFGLIEQSATMGNAFAGGAAAAEDASTLYFNPAGMTYLPDEQLVIGVHATRPSANFDNDGSTRSAATGGLATPGGGGGDGGGWAFIPNIYYAKAITPDIRLGIAISPLFGLKTEYDKDWVGRYQGIKSDLKTININPSIAFKVNEQISLGFGVSAMRAEAELTNAVDFGTLLGAPALFQRRDGIATIKGDDWAFGWNAGAIFQISDATRLGVSYRSKVHEKLEGTVSFSNVPAPLAANPAFSNGNVSAKLVTPDSVSLAIYHQIDDKWGMSGDIVWTGWSSFKDLTVVRNSGTQVASIPQNWQNAIRIAVGTNYKYNDRIKLRVGIAYDESPVPDEFRTPRIPDSDRIWLSLGGGYKLSPNSSIDVAYTHIFFEGSTLNKATESTIPAVRDNLKGNYDNYADILSAQYTYSF